MKIPFQKEIAEFRSARNEKNVERATALLVVTSPDRIRNGSAPRSTRRAVQNACKVLTKHHPSRVSNWYDSGNPFNDGSRSYLGGTLTDARYDQNQITRREAQRRMRIWEQNSGFVKSALDVGEQYVIGTHEPVVTSLSTDTAWAKRAEEVKREMDLDSGLNGESFFSQLCVGYRRKRVDGNVLLVKTSKPGFVTIRAGTKYETQLPVNKPCWQMVESHRIGTPFAMWQDENTGIFDGVLFKEIQTKRADGTIVRIKVKAGYTVNDSADIFSADQGFTFVGVDDCYYAATPHRVNEPRSMTDFYVAEPTLALLEDLLKMEMRAQEVQSEISVIIKNGAGQITTDQQAVLRALDIKVSTGPNGKPIVTAQDMEKIQAVYKKIWPGKTMVMRTGDEAAMNAPNRPAEATLNLWNFLIDLFCSSIGASRILTFPKTMSGKSQGTEVRVEIEKANGGFIKEFNLVWKPFIHMDWEMKMGWAIKNDERVKNPPPDWKNIDVSHPRSVVVDLGYAAAETVSYLGVGLINLHDVAQEFGKTRDKIISSSVKDVFDIKLACAQQAENPDYQKYGITVDAVEVRGSLVEAATALTAQSAAEKATVQTISET